MASFASSKLIGIKVNFEELSLSETLSLRAVRIVVSEFEITTPTFRLTSCFLVNANPRMVAMISGNPKAQKRIQVGFRDQKRTIDCPRHCKSDANIFRQNQKGKISFGKV